MILRVDRLQVELPAPSDPDPAAAAQPGPPRAKMSPETAGGPADPPEEPAVSSPGLHPGEIAEVVQKLMSRM